MKFTSGAVCRDVVVNSETGPSFRATLIEGADWRIQDSFSQE